MKNINDIFTHLKSNPQFRRLSTSALIQRLINLLPPKLKKGVKFAYVRKQTLFFVLSHPIYKVEFEYNKAHIKSLLKKAKIANVDDIGFFVTNRIEKKSKELKKEFKYEERSYGIFENKAKNEYVKNSFENIRNIIKNN